MLTINGPFIPLYARDVLARSDVAINRLFFAGALVAVITSVLAGRFIDLRRSRAVITAGVLAHTGLLLVWLHTGDHAVGVAVFTVSYAALLVAIIARDTLLADLTTPARRATVVGLVGTVAGIVGSVGPSAGAAAKGMWGPAAPFWLAAGLAVLVSLGLATLPTPGPSGTTTTVPPAVRRREP